MYKGLFDFLGKYTLKASRIYTVIRLHAIMGQNEIISDITDGTVERGIHGFYSGYITSCPFIYYNGVGLLLEA